MLTLTQTLRVNKPLKSRHLPQLIKNETAQVPDSRKQNLFSRKICIY